MAKKHKARCAGSTKVVSILVPKAAFTRREANAWMRRHDKRPTCKPVGAGRFWHCRQTTKTTNRVVGTIRFGRSGIIARIACA